MTKLRPPLSIENALRKVIGDLTLDRCAEVTGRRAHYLHALTDPDKREKLTVHDALALDLASMQAGNGAPLYETLGLMLKSAGAEIFSDAIAIGDAAVDVIREGSEAHVALFRAVRHGATAKDLRETLRELEESVEADTRAIAVIRAALDHRERAPP